MQITTLSQNHDMDKLSALVEQCSDYFLLLDGYMPDEQGLINLFHDIPPNHPQEGLTIYGLLEDKHLSGAIWCYRGYPEAKDAYIGLLLVAEAQRKRGLGRLLFQFVEMELRKEGFQKIQLAVIRDNKNALAFWPQLGFTFFKEHPAKKTGDKWHELLEFKMELG